MDLIWCTMETKCFYYFLPAVSIIFHNFMPKEKDSERKMTFTLMKNGLCLSKQN